MRHKLRTKLALLTPANCGLLLEATLHLLAARLALHLLPFHWLTWWFQRMVRSPELGCAARQLAIQIVCLSLYVANRRLSINAVCFPLSMAAQTMLRRRGVSTTLYYGAATLSDPGQLTAHVWLQDGDKGIVAHENISQFQILARYSPLQSASTRK